MPQASTAVEHEIEFPKPTIVMDELEAGEVAVDLDDREPQEVLAWTIERFGRADRDLLELSGRRLRPDRHGASHRSRVRVFTIDTGRTPQETYDLIDKVRERYGIKVETFMPDASVAQQMVTKHGNNLFYRDVNLRLLCCQVRKVLPLRRALMNYSGGSPDCDATSGPRARISASSKSITTTAES